MNTGTIKASPLKDLFINTLTQDVRVVTCILDLIDNSVDSYMRHQIKDRRTIDIKLSNERFLIFDTCGGIGKDFLETNVFIFGSTLERGFATLGMYGIGLKRSIFKLGNQISIRTDDGQDYCEMILNVTEWKKDSKLPWTIPYSYGKSRLNSNPSYTEIQISDLTPDVRDKFNSVPFINDVMETLKRTYCLFIADNLDFTLNEEKVEAYPLIVPDDQEYSPQVHLEQYNGLGIKIICFIDPSKGIKLSKAVNQVGWNIFCNSRLILANDTSATTGWIGTTKEDITTLPKYHPLFNNFRGLVFLDSEDPAKLPLNTSKSDLNKESLVYHYVLDKMVKTARPVIDYIYGKHVQEFANEEEIEQVATQQDPTFNPGIKSVVELTTPQTFKAPQKIELPPSIARIQYSKPKDLVDRARKSIGATSNKEVGERTFDYFVEMEEIKQP